MFESGNEGGEGREICSDVGGRGGRYVQKWEWGRGGEELCLKVGMSEGWNKRKTTYVYVIGINVIRTIDSWYTA